MKPLRPDSTRAATLMLLMDHELRETSRVALVQQLGRDGTDRRRLEQHERLRAQLARISASSSEPDLVDAVHRSLQRREHAARYPARRLWLGALASAAGVVLILGLGRWHPEQRGALPSRAGEPEFRAKAASESQAERWAGVHIYRVEPGREPTRISGEIQAGTPLLFSYVNLATPPLGYLLIYAVDSSAKVFWFHPAQLGRGSDPTSIPVAQTAAHVPIPEIIRHPLGIGDVEFYAVFTREPLHVRDVDAWLRSHPGQAYAPAPSQGMVQVIAARVVP